MHLNVHLLELLWEPRLKSREPRERAVTQNMSPNGSWDTNAASLSQSQCKRGSNPRKGTSCRQSSLYQLRSPGIFSLPLIYSLPRKTNRVLSWRRYPLSSTEATVCQIPCYMPYVHHLIYRPLRPMTEELVSPLYR